MELNSSIVVISDGTKKHKNYIVNHNVALVFEEEYGTIKGIIIPRNKILNYLAREENLRPKIEIIAPIESLKIHPIIAKCVHYVVFCPYNSSCHLSDEKDPFLKIIGDFLSHPYFTLDKMVAESIKQAANFQLSMIH